jgi:hypothetical protein
MDVLLPHCASFPTCGWGAFHCVGYFGYVTMVGWLGWGFSTAAGSVALAGLALGGTEGKVIM